MPNEEAARQSNPGASIRTPDQLQQAQRPDAPRSREAVDRPRETGETVKGTGILGQLRTERAHD